MSKYQCKCGGLLYPDFESYKVGDEVNFMIEKITPLRNGQLNVIQNARSGAITKILLDNIEIKSSGKTFQRYRYAITPKDAPGPIDYFRVGKCRCELDQQTKVEG